ncbi:sensor histidine kinase [Cohnella faecalis]|uniref:histidine kinase n=1 Tax=Cohnella faecalis TaxID=2315694 RepID=A0A398CHL9_9BACL|nr:sensor histidine kinase [Cohnella faecalis]RIE02273.1 sensor histidine kinase [Cohnella faecalis]
MKRSRLSSLLWLLVVIGVLGLFLPSIFSFKENQVDQARTQTAFFSKNWKVFYGAEPGPNSKWLPFDRSEQGKLTGYKGTVWIQRTLPKLNWADPHLFLSGMNHFEARLDGVLVYRYQMDRERSWNHFLMTQHPISLSPSDEGKLLSIKMEWDGLPFGWGLWAYAGNPDQIIVNMLRLDFFYYIYSILCIGAGLTGAVLFFKKRFDKLFLWFSILALSAGFGMLLLCQSLQWLANVEPLYYWRDLFLPLGVFAFTAFYGEALGGARRLSFRIAKGALSAFAALAFAVALWSPYWYWTLLVDSLPFITLAALSVVTFNLLRPSAKSVSSDNRKWLLRGYVVLLVAGLVHMTASMLPSFMESVAQAAPHLFNMAGNMLANGLLLFMLCMVMVLVNYVRNVYRVSERNAEELREKNAELERFHRDLETLVEIRTSELELANRSLSATLREKAETLAEVSVLEERNRIAHEMHDVVGHTLTAAIVQLEAAKKLAVRDGNLSMEKLGTVSSLVRKGLDDIRRTVRVLKTDEMSFQLDSALRELIKETIETMEVDVRADIQLPPVLGKLSEKVVYHALQEGLTNGIRHARCSRFSFELRPEENMLLFRLWNDGIPFGDSKPGFGLTSMMERVHLLGGTVYIGSAYGIEGHANGCELILTLPITDPLAS